MPLATVRLLALDPNVSIPSYLKALRDANVRPLVISKVVRWIVRPEKLSVSNLVHTKWDLVIIHLSSSPLPPTLLGADWVADQWSITAGIPSGLVNNFGEDNRRLLHPQPDGVPSLTGAATHPQTASSAQGLELDPELLEWIRTFELGRGAVSMFNLLAFKPGREAHESYLRYGKAFAESIGSRRGGKAKIVGKVVPGQGADGADDESGWDEVALAHYPSIHHFADMLASGDYQAINRRHRLPALKDTCILCTSELDPLLTEGKARL